ncbi:META domain-containing protein [Flavobacterium sp. ALJ2]|uniref:META domain-containing protein n=1 Tax=Flavobacterium sp. ALJ2 TaxID=2786960 RepID=UPI00189E5FF0|nr:META domain-containing protein [Flavobacterium sp. ALJ2]MBF7092433.1 META domain-containing protein [Flavobacterium sp. ALJ2]
MKKLFLLVSVAILSFSCKTAVKPLTQPKEDNPASMNTNNADEYDGSTFFKATGNEPFWGLKIGKETIRFTSLIEGLEEINSPYVDPIRAMDANVKLYRFNTKTGSMSITIQQMDCTDTMSGDKSPYNVKIEITNNSDASVKKIEGCGRYITDYRLHDIWVLEQLNGKKVAITDFQRELPRIEIYSAENRFSGFGGCNQVNGGIFYEKDVLRFTNVVSTEMACNAGNNKEDEFLKALQSTTTYTVANNRLSLSNPSGLLLVFKKVD